MTFCVRRLSQNIVGSDMIYSRCMFSILERVFTHALTPQPKEVICIDFFLQFQYIFMQTCDTKFSHCNLRKCVALSFENLKLILGFSKKERS